MMYQKKKTVERRAAIVAVVTKNGGILRADIEHAVPKDLFTLADDLKFLAQSGTLYRQKERHGNSTAYRYWISEEAMKEEREKEN